MKLTYFSLFFPPRYLVCLNIFVYTFSGSLPLNIKIKCDSLIDANNKYKMKNVALRKTIINDEPKRIKNISEMQEICRMVY